MQKIQGDETDANQRHALSQGARLRTAAWVTVLTLAVTSSAVLATACWVFSYNLSCCATHFTICSGDGGAWVCGSSTDGGPYVVRIYKRAAPGQKGRNTLTADYMGSCVRTPVTCSDIEGECVEGEPYGVLCFDTFAGGEACTG